VGHFVAEDDAGDAIGKGFADQGLGVDGFVIKMFAGNAKGYVEHDYLDGLRNLFDG
jgi:hypothetical protein